MQDERATNKPNGFTTQLQRIAPRAEANEEQSRRNSSGGRCIITYTHRRAMQDERAANKPNGFTTQFQRIAPRAETNEES